MVTSQMTWPLTEICCAPDFCKCYVAPAPCRISGLSTTLLPRSETPEISARIAAEEIVLPSASKVKRLRGILNSLRLEGSAVDRHGDYWGRRHREDQAAL